MRSSDIARGLAWFGIGLGVVEIVAPRAFSRATGIEHRNPPRSDLRDQRDRGRRHRASREGSAAWLWTRGAGDLLDGALLGSGTGADDPHRQRTLLATLAVAPVVAMDIAFSRLP